jgi:F420-dependent oxidoreductase-like protein
VRIGISGRTTGIDKVVEQARRAEADGFSSIWYSGGGGGDALTAAAFAGRATERIEVGTAVLATYAVHPFAMAARAVAAADAVGAEGRFVLGIGPSHEPAVEGMLGLSYARPGRHTEEYVAVLAAQLRGEAVTVDGEELRVALPPASPPPFPVPVLLAALGPRLLRVAGERCDGTVLWLANAEAIRTHVVPRITAAASAAGRPPPRVVAGLPVCVHDDVDEARAAAATQFALYGGLPNYQRILARGGADQPADAVVVGDEAAVRRQLDELFEAGATDVWADAFPAGDDRAASRARTTALLRELAA